MGNYVLLLLDTDCLITSTDVIRASDDSAAIAAARESASRVRSWGYELWRGGQRVAAFHDCKHPPARIAAV